MRVRGLIRGVWQQLRGSFWLVPTVVAAAGIPAAVGMVELSALVDSQVLSHYPRIFGADAESSRSALATIAGSIITVAGVTFSITVVVLSQAATQYTPRILRNFMRDRPSQVSLGVLVGVFLYCLVVIRTIRGDGQPGFVPALAVVLAFVLAVAAIAVLIYFIHHIASTLEAGSIVARIHSETIQAIDRTCPEPFMESGEEQAWDASTPNDLCIAAPVTGYLQSMDTGEIVALADRCDVTFRLEREIGGFVVRGTPLIRVHGAGAGGVKAAAVLRTVTIDTYRTVFQDFAFGARQIADIALKALSPAMNDTTTAILCLDYLESILSRLACRRIERQFSDQGGTTRLVMPGPVFRDLADTLLDEIRIAGASNPRVLRRLLTLVEVVGASTAEGRRRATLLAHAGRIGATVDGSVRTEPDRQAVREASRRAQSVLTSAPRGTTPRNCG